MIYIKEGCEEAFACHPPVELRQADPQVSVSYIVVGQRWVERWLDLDHRALRHISDLQHQHQGADLCREDEAVLTLCSLLTHQLIALWSAGPDKSKLFFLTVRGLPPCQRSPFCWVLLSCESKYGTRQFDGNHFQ